MLLVENFYNPVFGSRKRIIRALNDVNIDVTGYRYDEENNELYTQRMIENKIYELKLNKIAARWPAKAVAQFSTPK